MINNITIDHNKIIKKIRRQVPYNIVGLNRTIIEDAISATMDEVHKQLNEKEE